MGSYTQLESSKFLPPAPVVTERNGFPLIGIVPFLIGSLSFAVLGDHVSAACSAVLGACVVCGYLLGASQIVCCAIGALAAVCIGIACDRQLGAWLEEDLRFSVRVRSAVPWLFGFVTFMFVANRLYGVVHRANRESDFLPLLDKLIGIALGVSAAVGLVGTVVICSAAVESRRADRAEDRHATRLYQFAATVQQSRIAQWTAPWLPPPGDKDSHPQSCGCHAPSEWELNRVGESFLDLAESRGWLPPAVATARETPSRQSVPPETSSPHDHRRPPVIVPSGLPSSKSAKRTTNRPV